MQFFCSPLKILCTTTRVTSVLSCNLRPGRWWPHHHPRWCPHHHPRWRNHHRTHVRWRPHHRPGSLARGRDLYAHGTPIRALQNPHQAPPLQPPQRPDHVRLADPRLPRDLPGGRPPPRPPPAQRPVQRGRHGAPRVQGHAQQHPVLPRGQAGIQHRLQEAQGDRRVPAVPLPGAPPVPAPRTADLRGRAGPHLRRARRALPLQRPLLCRRRAPCQGRRRPVQGRWGPHLRVHSAPPGVESFCGGS
jgi:hypothetical protein